MKALLLLALLTSCGNDGGPPADSGPRDSGPHGDLDSDGYQNAVDCDDANPAVHPDADETCNGLDDDCDGVTDEDDAIDAPAWYLDADSDGYGDPSTGVWSCSQPPTYVSDNTDCDDTRPEISPDAIDACEDGVDQDCNGSDRACRYSGDFNLEDDSRVVKLSGEVDRNHAGMAVSEAGDVNGDGFDDILVGAAYCVGAGPPCYGNAYVVYGPVERSLRLSHADARLRGEGDGLAGESLDGVGDLNGDGYSDFLVGDRFNSDAGERAGAVYLLHGPVTGDIELYDADAKFLGERGDDWAGFSVSSAGDVNDDGIPDLMVGAPQHDIYGGEGIGIVYLLFGPVAKGGSLAAADVEIGPETGGGDAGTALAHAGDINGDGFADLLISGDADVGDALVLDAVYLLYGPVSVDLSLSSADARFVGDIERRAFGEAVSGAGDINGDGYGDFLVGAPTADGSSKYEHSYAYVFYGPVTAGGDVTSAAAAFRSEGVYDWAGSSVSGAGDVDGDGFDDFLVGADQAPVVDVTVGTAYLFYGPVTASGDLSLADARFQGGDVIGNVGHAVSGAGDMDVDGSPDFLIGGPIVDDGDGAAYLILSSKVL
jgi:hypothetical protein